MRISVKEPCCRVCVALVLGLCWLVQVALGQSALPVGTEHLRMPSLFTENAGQWDARVRYAHLGASAQVLCTDEGLTIVSWTTRTPARSAPTHNAPVEHARPDGLLMEGSALPSNKAGQLRDITVTTYRFSAPVRAGRMTGVRPATTVHHFYPGADSSRWRQDVPTYGCVRYTDVWPGVDLEYTIVEGRVRQEIRMRDSADPSSIRIIRQPQQALPDTMVFQAETPADFADAGTARVAAPQLQRLRLQTEFDSYLGGYGVDLVYDATSDQAGCMIVLGFSYSPDFPTVRAVQNQLVGGTCNVVLAKFAASGDSLVFSTFFGTGFIGTLNGIEYGRYGENGVQLSHLILRDGIITITFPCVQGELPILPVDARRRLDPDPPAKYQRAVARFSATGIALASNSFGCWFLHAITTHPDGGVYMLGKDLGLSPFRWFTNDSICRSSSGAGCYFLLQVTWRLDSIQFAGYVVGSSSLYDLADMRVDSQGGIILLVNSFPTERSLPVVHAFQALPGGYADLYLMKLSPDKSRIVFATYLGGSSTENLLVEMSSRIQVDGDDNITILAPSASTDYPLYKPLFSKDQVPRHSFQIVATSFTPTGECRWSTYLPIPPERIHGVAFDSCASLLIFAFSPDSPQYNRHLYRLRSDGSSIDSTQRFSMLETWGVGSWSRLYAHGGYVYAVANIRSDVGVLDGYQPRFIGPEGSEEMLISRTYLGGCEEYLSCQITVTDASTGAAVDSLFIDARRRTVTPARLRIAAIVRNTDSRRSATHPELTLVLPPELVLDPPGQSLIRRLAQDPLPPYGTDTLVWDLRFDSSAVLPATLDLHVLTAFRNPSLPQGVPLSFTQCARALPVVYRIAPDPMLACMLTAPDSLIVDAAGVQLLPNPFTLSLQIANRDTQPVTLPLLRLQIPAGMAVETVPAADTVRTGPSLLPGATQVYTWQIVCRTRPQARTIGFAVTAREPYGLDVASCATSVVVPGTDVLRCTTAGSSTLLHDASSGTQVPDPLRVQLQLDNPIDTLRAGIVAELDTSGLRALGLGPGEVAERRDILVNRQFRAQMQWDLTLRRAPVTPLIDTLVFRYRAPGDAQWRICTHPVTITTMSRTLACDLRMPDTLVISDGGQAPARVQVTMHVVNTGTEEASGHRASLVFPANVGVSSLDSIERSIGMVPAGRADSVRWSLEVQTSGVNRLVPVEVVIRDASGVERARCSHAVFIPRITVDLACTLTAPDSIAYDVAGDVHVPDPFTVQVALENRLDTLRPLVETEIDLTHAPHLALAAGESVRRTLTDIPARGQASAEYRLTVRRPLTSPVRDTVLVRTRAVGDSTWQACAHPVFIDGRERIVSVSCATRGQDTLWGDPYYETVIPLPLQVEYALTNTGNAPLRSCAVAILPPPMYVLAGSDSVQQYGEIAPGATVRRDWLLTLDPAQAVPGTSAIAFVPQCAELSAPPVCTRPVTLAVGAPEGIVLTPWRLHFAAEQGGALPAAQQVTLWTGNGASIFWQAVPDAGWLRAEPGLGSVKTVMDVQPTTTALAAGMHEGMVTVSAGRYVRPHRIEATYTLTTIVSTAELPIPQSIELGPAYPNPATGEVRIDILLDAPRAVLLELYDLYGRRVAQLHEGPLTAGRHTIRWSAAGLPSGLYLHLLRTDRGTLTRSVVVRR